MVLFVYFWLCCVFVATWAFHCSVWGWLSGCSSWALVAVAPLVAVQAWSTGPAVVARRLRSSVARGAFPDQGSNPCPLHCQVDSSPLSHQESPYWWLFYFFIKKKLAKLFQGSYHFLPLKQIFFHMYSVRMEPFSLNQITSISGCGCSTGLMSSEVISCF